jgi:RluA family pseudouridine synthase
VKKSKPNLPLIIYEDDCLLVINKPAGLLVVSRGNTREKTAYSILAGYLERKHRRPAVLHRLDKDTSGVMLFAKNEKTKKYFMDNWNTVVKERLYEALVEGELHENSGTVDAPLGEDRNGRITVRSDGQRAVTHWKLLGVERPQTGAEHPRLQVLSRVEVSLETGRRNQIRAHFAHIGHPVSGDIKYGDNSAKNHLRLHAKTIAFIHPASRDIMAFSVKTPW